MGKTSGQSRENIRESRGDNPCLLGFTAGSDVIQCSRSCTNERTYNLTLLHSFLQDINWGLG